ncbi:hypothetical protein M0R45_030125 [Rubus argutus]|uniref:MULE transposase domain-containing protein n=1 Tax=Rubus argutus TaxID=59490 RepID=A0AAW1WCL9_RUBAR
MGFKGVISDDNEPEDDLESWDGSETEEDEQGNPLPKSQPRRLKVKSWNSAVDLKNPKFCISQAFANSEVLKEAVREFALQNQLGLWFSKNSPKKIQVKCQVGCLFWLYASPIGDEDPTLYIKTLRLAHKCHPVQVLPYLNANRIAEEVAQDLMVNPEWQRAGVLNHIQKKFKLDVSIQTVYRGTKAAKKKNEGHYIDQYNKLAAYRQELKRSNPGSTVEIKTKMDGNVRRFQRMYICLVACKEGWLKGCRPIIGLYGCHIKGQHPGQLLAVIGIDPNNGMFPIAYAICEVENTETWKWFIEYLKHCVRHLYNNFKTKHPGEGLKQTLWNVVRSSTLVWFNKHMEDMRRQSENAWKWFEDKDVAH